MQTVTTRRGRLLWALAGLIAVVIAGRAVEVWSPRIGAETANALAFLAAWIPMAAAILLALRGTTLRGAAAELGLRIRPLDVLWGIALGFAARAADSFIRLSLAPSSGPGGQPTLGAAVTGSALALGLLAPVIIAPLVEECFFRGLMQRTLSAGGAPSRLRTAGAVLVASLAFAAVHVVLSARTPTDVTTIGAGTFVFSLGSGLAAAATGRLGASILGHMAFNGLGVLLTWPAPIGQ